ncbi:MAG: hypothetical protein ACTHOD_06220, partial [Motilibacteraceae bacterium]
PRLGVSCRPHPRPSSRGGGTAVGAARTAVPPTRTRSGDLLSASGLGRLDEVGVSEQGRG